MNYTFNSRSLFKTSVLILFLFLGWSCEDDETVYSPKPKGYVRINFPQKTYQVLETDCPYSFEIPKYASPIYNTKNGSDPCWFNLYFAQFKATIHFSYKPITNNLSEYLRDSHNFATKHEIKATGIDELPVLRDSAKVYGLIFDISGNTASSIQFYLTDSTKHFLRGALYFNTTPNIDSLKIVVDFLKADVLHIVQTTRWK